MNPRKIRRRAHTRLLDDGRRIPVRETIVHISSEPKAERGPFRHLCSDCGAEVLSVPMPNGGWVHFEGRDGLTTVKHPCLARGQRLSAKRDENTLDLFENLTVKQS